MQIVDSSVEQLGENRYRLITTVEVYSRSSLVRGSDVDIGDGPTGDAIPDRIVRCLLELGPGSVALGDIQRHVGGNPSTVNRQAWTLAENAADLQLRLRGWVVKTERGRYALSEAAKAKIARQRGGR